MKETAAPIERLEVGLPFQDAANASVAIIDVDAIDDPEKINGALRQLDGDVLRR